jgi:hypothetical protein
MSAAFPEIVSAQIGDHLEKGRNMDDTAWSREVRAWIRKEIRKEIRRGAETRCRRRRGRREVGP